MHQSSTQRPARVLVPALVLLVIGGAIGVADAFIRSDKLAKKRAAPPPLAERETPATMNGGAAPANTQQDRPPTTPTQPPQPQADESTPEPQSAPTPAAAAAPAAAFTPTPADKMPEGHITVDQAQRLYNEGAVFVDARKKELYIEGHVPQAFRADMASFRGREPAIVTMVPKEMVLVVYCGGGNCDESEHVAQLLDASGFKTIYIMHDGFPGWKAAGYEVETGEGME